MGWRGEGAKGANVGNDDGLVRFSGGLWLPFSQKNNVNITSYAVMLFPLRGDPCVGAWKPVYRLRDRVGADRLLPH
ncbi:MAG: hypothetical protein BWY17_02469 [Deltaproteobacteria bacterium ADurb.Bin207]|jgi:hypothetical protein|nr:MAG: hypothetical protein BWY17_02469 [Deltaproteobacteria bacterium ADurb.Bin207]